MNPPLDIETDASHPSIGVILKHGGHPMEYHSETVLEAMINYNTYFHIFQYSYNWAMHSSIGFFPFEVFFFFQPLAPFEMSLSLTPYSSGRQKQDQNSV